LKPRRSLSPRTLLLRHAERKGQREWAGEVVEVGAQAQALHPFYRGDFLPSSSARKRKREERGEE